MNRQRKLGIVAFLVALAFLASFSFAEAQNISETTTIYLPLSEEKPDLNVSQWRSFYSNVTISRYEGLHAFVIKFKGSGSSNVSLYVQTQLCGHDVVGSLKDGEYICTDQLTSNLSSLTLLNITLYNNGQADSYQQNLTPLMILNGYFTIDQGTTINVSTLSQADLNALNASINAHTTATVANLQSVLLGFLTTSMPGYVWNYTVSTGNTADYELVHGGSLSNTTNVSVNASAVWSHIFTQNNLTAQQTLYEDWRYRWVGMSDDSPCWFFC